MLRAVTNCSNSSRSNIIEPNGARRATQRR
jgi:hypothetical protein